MKNLLLSEMNGSTWITAAGVHVRVKRMNDHHLVCAVKWLRRNEFRLRFDAVMSMLRYAEEAPDGAADCACDEADTILNMPTDEFLCWHVPPYAKMLHEITRRRLTL